MCPASADRTIPDIFKVAVRRLSRLLLGGQVQLFRKLPQSSSMKDSWRQTHTHTHKHKTFAFKCIILQAEQELLHLVWKSSLQ